ncbi:hypothetical protein T484DRAFT_1758290 [Baffinella frigidus]|nr:hypothetical protein T484DRAFT_1758290 [Cryptophyta sp. CCMP2293]
MPDRGVGDSKSQSTKYDSPKNSERQSRFRPIGRSKTMPELLPRTSSKIFPLDQLQTSNTTTSRKALPWVGASPTSKPRGTSELYRDRIAANTISHQVMPQVRTSQNSNVRETIDCRVSINTISRPVGAKLFILRDGGLVHTTRKRHGGFRSADMHNVLASRFKWRSWAVSGIHDPLATLDLFTCRTPPSCEFASSELDNFFCKTN